MTLECAAHSAFAASDNCPLVWLADAGTIEFVMQPSIFSTLCFKTSSAFFSLSPISVALVAVQKTSRGEG